MLLSAALAALLAAPASAQEAGALYAEAQADVQGALTDIHVLLAAAQARFKQLAWDYNAWGRNAERRRAQAVFAALGERLSAFRGFSEAVTRAGDPLGRELAALEKSPRVAKARRAPLPDSTGGIIAELLALRAGYDADARRSALIRAAARANALAGRWGRPALSAPQQNVIGEAGGMLAALQTERARFAAELPPAGARGKAARRRVEERLKALGGDIEALGVEIKRLRLHYQLNNYQSMEQAP